MVPRHFSSRGGRINYLCLKIYIIYIISIIKKLHNEFQTEILRVVRLKKLPWYG